IEPPGCTSAATPAEPAVSGPSGKGKNASLARDEPRMSRIAAAPFSIARRTQSTRLVCSAPVPAAQTRFATTIALSLTSSPADARGAEWVHAVRLSGLARCVPRTGLPVLALGVAIRAEAPTELPALVTPVWMRPPPLAVVEQAGVGLEREGIPRLVLEPGGH